MKSHLSTLAPPREATRETASGVGDVLARTVGGERLSDVDALALLHSHDLTALGRAANAVSERLNPGPFRTYNIDRNINYTNACTAVCDFARSTGTRSRTRSTSSPARFC